MAEVMQMSLHQEPEEDNGVMTEEKQMKEIMKFSELEFAAKSGKGLNLDAFKRNRNKTIKEEQTSRTNQHVSKAVNDF